MLPATSSLVAGPAPLPQLIFGCGYLGRRVAARWIARGKTVQAVTRSEANAGELRSIGILAFLGDVMLPETLPEFREVDTVLYAVGLDRRSGRSQREVYVDGLSNVLDRLAPANVRRFVYVSSTSVYGQNAGEWVDEESPCEPSTPNGRVCLEAERLLRERLPSATIVRLSGIYGPGRLIARIEQLRAGTPMDGNPEAWLNLIHVDDAVAAIEACARRETPGQTFLVSDDRPIRREEYYSRLAALFGAPAPTFAAPAAGGAAGLPLNKRCRNSRLRSELAVALRYPTIAEGIPAVLAGVCSAAKPQPNE